MLSMILKLGMRAEHSWRRLRGFEWLAKVISGVKLTGSKFMNNSRIGMFKRRAGPPADQPAYTRFDNSSPKNRGRYTSSKNFGSSKTWRRFQGQLERSGRSFELKR